MSEAETTPFITAMRSMLDKAPDSTRIGIRAGRIFLSTMLQTDRDDATPDASAVGSMLCMLVGMLRAEAAIGGGLALIADLRKRQAAVDSEDVSLSNILDEAEARIIADAQNYLPIAIDDVVRNLTSFPVTESLKVLFEAQGPSWMAAVIPAVFAGIDVQERPPSAPEEAPPLERPEA